MAKVKSRKPGIFSLILSILIIVLFVVGLICLFVLDSNGGVGLTATTQLGNIISGIGFLFIGLSALFGGEARIGSFLIINGEAGELSDLGLKMNLNPNVGAIVGLIIFVIGVLTLLFLRKRKLGLLIGTILTLAGSILLLCSGQFFSMANEDTIGGLDLKKYGTIIYADTGCLIAGVMGLGIFVLGTIQTIIGFVKNYK